MTRPSGLGRGLGALIPSTGPGESGYLTLKLTSIVPNPRQPRGDFAEDRLAELAHSLREVGMLQPILVRAVDDDRYEIIAGERRYRAARLAGLDEVPAIVRNTADDQVLTEALVENIHRHDLNPLEEAAAYHQLLEDFGMTHDQLAQRLGRSRSGITNFLRLLNLPTAVQQRLADGTLTAGHARALLGLEDPGLQERAAQRVVAEGLSVRATEELVRKLAGQADAGSSLGDLAQAAKDRNRSPYEGLQRRIADALATRVRIRGSARRGRIVIDYAGQADLERLLGVLSRGTGEDLLTE